jgi:sugar/nucleoside kinase (ribokinase family)
MELATGQSIEDSVVFASAAAALAVSRLGAQPSFPAIEEIQAFFRQPLKDWQCYLFS